MTVTRTLEFDYLVVGAGATGMAFTDALVDHADVRVALVDRRHGVGGHWLAAYPFVRLRAPDIPSESPPRFEVGDGARVIPVGDLARLP